MDLGCGAQDPRESRNTMKPIATGVDSLADQSKWPPELFAPNTLCYGLVRVRFDDDDTFPPSFVSFCWKGRSLPIYLRTKYTEFNHVIRVSRLGTKALGRRSRRRTDERAACVCAPRNTWQRLRT